MGGIRGTGENNIQNKYLWLCVLIHFIIFNKADVVLVMYFMSIVKTTVPQSNITTLYSTFSVKLDELTGQI